MNSGIEIAPERVKAGVAVLAGYDWEWSDDSDFAIRIVLAVLRAGSECEHLSGAPLC